MQDSLTKTIPIWATVLNRAVAQLRSYHDSTRLVRDSAFVISSYPKSAQSKPEPLNSLKSTLPNGEPAAKARGGHQVHAVKTASTDQDWDTSLHLPPWVSSNERLQIEAKLDQWVRDLCQVSLHNLHMAADVMLFCQHAQSDATASCWLHKGFASIMAAATECCLQTIFRSPFCSSMPSTSLALSMTCRLRLDCVPGIP